MSKPLVIAFTGKRGSGKSAAADYFIEEHGAQDLKFAGPLKNMLRAMYTTCGLDEDIIEQKVEGDLKEVPCDWLMGKTPRYAMQTIGTEWREMIHTDMWSEMFKRAILSGNMGDFVVCSDFRFPHESTAIDQLGGYKVMIERPDGFYEDSAASQHSSETMLENLPVHQVITNDGSLEDLYAKLEKMYERI